MWKQVLHRMIHAWSHSPRSCAVGAFLLIVVPSVASAGFFDILGRKASAEETTTSSYNSQTIHLLEGVKNPDPKVAIGGGDITIVDGVALSADGAPVPEGEGFHSANPGEISTYIVREGDTLSQIATMFDVTMNTIRWANDLTPKQAIQPGDKLVILPITGVRHMVKKGETLATLAKKYKGTVEEIAQFNGLHEGDALAVGDEIIIPDGEVVSAPSSSKSSSGSKLTYGGPTYAGYFMRPIAGGVRTQGIHGYNGVDLASSYGASIFAAAAGEVIISHNDGGWNGGYGNYIVIRHDNGTQTLYAHLSSSIVAVGDTVTQGQTIGYMGNTGRSTGTHLHFEVRGASNPF